MDGTSNLISWVKGGRRYRKPTVKGGLYVGKWDTVSASVVDGVVPVFILFDLFADGMRFTVVSCWLFLLLVEPKVDPVITFSAIFCSRFLCRFATLGFAVRVSTGDVELRCEKSIRRVLKLDVGVEMGISVLVQLSCDNALSDGQVLVDCCENCSMIRFKLSPCEEDVFRSKSKKSHGYHGTPSFGHVVDVWRLP